MPNPTLRSGHVTVRTAYLELQADAPRFHAPAAAPRSLAAAGSLQRGSVAITTAYPGAPRYVGRDVFAAPALRFAAVQQRAALLPTPTPTPTPLWSFVPPHPRPPAAPYAPAVPYAYARRAAAHAHAARVHRAAPGWDDVAGRARDNYLLVQFLDWWRRPRIAVQAGGAARPRLPGYLATAGGRPRAARRGGGPTLWQRACRSVPRLLRQVAQAARWLVTGGFVLTLASVLARAATRPRDAHAGG